MPLKYGLILRIVFCLGLKDIVDVMFSVNEQIEMSFLSFTRLLNELKYGLISCNHAPWT